MVMGSYFKEQALRHSLHKKAPLQTGSRICTQQVGRQEERFSSRKKEAKAKHLFDSKEGVTSKLKQKALVLSEKKEHARLQS